MTDVPHSVLSAWAWGGPPAVVPADSGLINASFVVTVDGRTVGVLQRLNTRIFTAAVHEDIEAVTSRLAAAGLVTPRLVRTRADGLFHEDESGVWRVLTPVGRTTVHKLVDPALARSAGRLVARFHAAVRDLDHEFRSVRPGAHDTPRHMRTLAEALDAHPTHRLRDAVAPVAAEILERWSRWTGPADLPRRVIHGDLKISNVRFDGAEAVALIDLDTMARDTLQVELGDALRSWCNPASEDAERARFDLAVFDAAVTGYAEGDSGATDAEWAAIVPGIERISLELSARFAADALNEAYFGFDPRHGTRGDHNLLRARGQLSLARTVRAAAPHAERKIAQARR